MLGTIIFIYCLFLEGIRAIDYEDNDLAKICRPLNRQLDILFILDGSGSVSGDVFNTQIAMLERIVNMVEIGLQKTQIAVMQYSSYTKVEFGFNEHSNDETLREVIKKIHHISGTTKTGKALDKAFNIFNQNELYGARTHKEDVAQVAIVVTDGHSQDDPVPAARRLRKAGIAILALGIGGHINMGELIEITGHENLAFQNLTLHASLDKFSSEFKKIAVGEHCEFARGPNGAEIVCKSDSIDVSVSTANTFHGHMYVVGHFNQVDCVSSAWNTSKEIRLEIGLNTCDIKKQYVLNPKGRMFETSFILKFHPSYNTKKDKLFNIRCFYPENSQELSKRLIRNNIAISDSNKEIKMPCSYQISIESVDGNQCKLQDANVGDQITHLWKCSKEFLDSYQSFLVHSCVLVDVNSGLNRTIIDRNGCVLDSSVIDPPVYQEPLTVSAIGRAVKFPDSSLVKMKCHLRFCDRLLGECDDILPAKCRKRRQTQISRSISETQDIHQFSLPFSVHAADDEIDDDYNDSISTSPPLLTFPAQRLERKFIAARRNFEYNTQVAQLIRKIETNTVANSDEERKNEPTVRIITAGEQTARIRPIVINGRTADGQPKVVDFPIGGLDVHLNTQDVRIISRNASSDIKADTKWKAIETSFEPSTPTTATIAANQTTRSADVLSTTVHSTSTSHSSTANAVNRTSPIATSTTSTSTIASSPKSTSVSSNTDDPFQNDHGISNDIKPLEEESAEKKPIVQLEERIATTVKHDSVDLESQIIYIRDLEIVLDAKRKEKPCIRRV